MFNDPESIVEIRLKRQDRTYRPNDNLEGTLVVVAPEQWDYKNIVLSVLGNVRLTEDPANKSFFKDSQKPLGLLHETIAIEGGRFPAGRTEIPFEAEVKGINGMPLLNSYSGVYLSIGYHIAVKIERGLMRKEISKSLEFIVEVPSTDAPPDNEIPFEITPSTLEKVKSGSRAHLKTFRILGKLHQQVAAISRPLTGEIVVEESETPIKSLEVQLVRVETVEQAEGRLREATEIQNLQIGDGDVCRGMAIPIYMVFPRLFSCPTIVTPRFRVEFEVNIIVCFTDGYTAMQNFQVMLV